MPCQGSHLTLEVIYPCESALWAASIPPSFLPPWSWERKAARTDSVQRFQSQTRDTLQCEVCLRRADGQMERDASVSSRGPYKDEPPNDLCVAKAAPAAVPRIERERWLSRGAGGVVVSKASRARLPTRRGSQRARGPEILMCPRPCVRLHACPYTVCHLHGTPQEPCGCLPFGWSAAVEHCAWFR